MADLASVESEPPLEQPGTTRQHCPGHRHVLPTRRERDDWHWQWAHRLRRSSDLEQVMDLLPREREAFCRNSGALPFAVTPYYLGLIDPSDPSDPIRRCVIPTAEEAVLCAGEADDPLGEERDSPFHGLVHRYPDRVLLLATDRCATYCRYCTRSRLVGRGHHARGRRHLERCIAYIRSRPEVRDVLVSGGDPLTLEDQALEWLLRELRAIPHVQIVRIGTKVPAVMPQRITPALVQMLRRYHPLWMSLHFTHPAELTVETREACERLADAGIPLGSQTVLLRGVNDDPATMRDLMLGLLRCRVRPYYLYQCDPIPGSSHFRTPVSAGVDIVRSLRGFVTGYAVPTYVIDAPEGGGKIPVMPETCLGHDGDDLQLISYTGDVYRYPDDQQRRGDTSGPCGARAGRGGWMPCGSA